MHDPCVRLSENVTVTEIGECMVRGLSMRERGELGKAIAANEGIYGPQLTLASIMITDLDGVRIWDPDNWDIWAGKHDSEAADLFNITTRVAGYGLDDAKKN